MSAPVKWENFRLAKVKRTSGENLTDTFTGTLRLIFTANINSSTVEAAVFYADFVIDSDLTYQRCRLGVVQPPEESTTINAGETETVAGFITFRTLSQSDPIVQAFYEFLAPPTDTTDADGDGFYDVPSVYETLDTVAAGTGVDNDFNPSPLSHGTGILLDSTYSPMPLLDSDIQSWINAFNYPFDAEASRVSTGTASVEIPIGLFREFDITVPASDEATTDSSGQNNPVWVSSIEIIDTAGDQMRFFFSTHNVTDSPSLEPIEFAKMDLTRTMVPGQIVEIETINNLRLDASASAALSNQEFGRGHVVLSSEWDGTSGEVDCFFDALGLAPDNSAEFTQANTRVSSFGLSRVPRFSPSKGEHEALRGSTSRLTDTPIALSDDNRYINEQDQGLGDRIDLEALTAVDPVNGIDRYGYTGALAHRIVNLCIDYTKIPTGEGTTEVDQFYEDEILPRLTALLGRAPAFGDFWYDGTRLKFYNGDSWQG
jgi:hypothetical protein